MQISDIMTANVLVWKSFLALGLLIIGIFIGRGISYLLKELTEKLDLGKKMRPSFISLIITLIRWSIYILFLNFALNQLPWPGVTQTITKSLIVIPSFVGSVIILSFGFAIASYLKTTVEGAHEEWKFLAMYLFYFVVLISGIYALRLALFALSLDVLNYLTIIFSTIFALAVGYSAIKKN